MGLARRGINRHQDRVGHRGIISRSDASFLARAARWRLRPPRTDRAKPMGRSPQVRDYELTLILRPELGEDGITATTDKVGGWIAASGGEVCNVVNAGRKRLAYQVKHSRDGA